MIKDPILFGYSSFLGLIIAFLPTCPSKNLAPVALLSLFLVPLCLLCPSISHFMHSSPAPLSPPAFPSCSSCSIAPAWSLTGVPNTPTLLHPPLGLSAAIGPNISPGEGMSPTLSYPPGQLHDFRPITIDPSSQIHQSLGSPILAPRIRRVSLSGNRSNPVTVQLSLSLPGTPFAPIPIFPPLPVESSPPPLPYTALRYAHALRASRTASPPDPSPHGGTLPSSFPPTSASSATRTSTPLHRSHSPPAHDPRTRTFQRNRAPRLSSRLSHYGPISPDQLLFSLPFSSHRSASPGQRSPVPLRASRTPRSPASSRPLPALILVQRRLLERQRSRSSRRC